LKNIINLLKSSISVENIVIWHLAANSDIAKGMKNPNVELEDTFMTTVNLSKVAREINAKRIIFSSSSAVYGDHQNQKLLEHQTELAPISYYGSFKLASETFLRAFSYESGIELLIYRFPNVIGERMTHGLLYDLPKKIDFKQKKVNVLGDGLQKKPYYYVKDLIDSMIELASKTRIKIDVFNLGPNDDGIEINHIVELFLRKNFPEINPCYGDTAGGWKGDVPVVNLSVDKMLQAIPTHNRSSLEAVMKTLASI
jgi:UDP-glucose 4-epimerase